MPDLFGWYEFICSLYQPVQVAYILLMRRSSGDSIQRSFFSDYSFFMDHVGACGRFDRPSCPCHGVYDECVPQLPLLFLQQHVHDALENTGTKMSVFFAARAIFGGPRTW